MALTMAQVFGEFTEDFSERSEFLVLGFSPSSLPIQLRWKTNGLSADFLGDYVKNFFPGDTSAALNKQTEVRHAVSFVANELLENAMKYSDKCAGQPINLEVHLFSDRLIFISKIVFTKMRSPIFSHTYKTLPMVMLVKCILTKLKKVLILMSQKVRDLAI